MQVGEVFRWKNLKHPQFGGRTKPRWFLCLGDSGIILPPKNFYFFSTTCTLRDGVSKFDFDKTKYPFFYEDCYFYYTEPPYAITEEQRRKNESDISEVGKIDEGDLRIIYEGIIKSPFLNKRIKLDIHQSFNLIGISGLRRPRF